MDSVGAEGLRAWDSLSWLDRRVQKVIKRLIHLICTYIHLYSIISIIHSPLHLFKTSKIIMDAYHAHFSTNQNAGSQPAQNHTPHGANVDYYGGEAPVPSTHAEPTPDHQGGEEDRGLGSLMKKLGGKEGKESKEGKAGKAGKAGKEGKEDKDGEDGEEKKKGKASKIMKLGMKA